MCTQKFFIGLQWCVNYCSTWTKIGTLINFSKYPNKKIQWKSVQGLEFLYADTYRQTSILKLRDKLLQNFITNMPKKNLLDLSSKCYQALFLVVEQLKSTPNLPNKCSRENYSQLANICNIKVKQELELIMSDIKVICQHLYKWTNNNYGIINQNLHINRNKWPI